MGINISFGDTVRCVLGIAQFVIMKENNGGAEGVITSESGVAKPGR
jgi:hypothetical protein